MSGDWNPWRFCDAYTRAYLRLWRGTGGGTPNQERMPKAMGMSRRWYYDLRRRYGLPFPLSIEALYWHELYEEPKPAFRDERARQEYWFQVCNRGLALLRLLLKTDLEERKDLLRLPRRLPRQPSGCWDAPRRRQRRVA